MRRHLKLATAVVIAVIALVACGPSTDMNTAVEGPQARESVGAEQPDETVTMVPDYTGNPGDILSLSNLGVAENVLAYDGYKQMRDYSDSVVVARFASIDIASEPAADGTLSGVSLLSFDVVETLGGRAEPALRSGQLTLTLPLDGDRETQETVLSRLEDLEDRATYVLFLRRATPQAGVEGPLYVANIDVGPPGILAVWPRDGRLSPVSPSNDLVGPAIARGEQLTGTTAKNEVDAGPQFEGEVPIGLTLEEVRSQFAKPVGSTETEPPSNWDGYLKAATAVGAYR